MKHAQQLSIQTIIVAALFLALVIIIIALLAQRGGEFGKAVSECSAQGGKCVTSTVQCFQQGGHPLDFTCPKKENPACCKL